MQRIIEALAEMSVIGSYGAPGYERRSRDFNPADLQVDLNGQTALVTGASTGIGRVLAIELARRGARVILVARDTPRLTAAMTDVERVARAQPLICPTDLSDLAAVEALARFVAAKATTLDLLVQNAGVLLDRRQLSVDGLELTLATNLIGPFALQARLEPLLMASRAARCVTVTSGGMYTQRIDLALLQGPPERWDGVVAYAQTKRAQVVLNRLWADRWRATTAVAHAMHPGWADTPGVASSLPRFHSLTRPLLRTPEQGADTALWLAIAPLPGTCSGRLWLDRAPRREHVLWHTRAGDTLDQPLWELCLQLARVTLSGVP